MVYLVRHAEYENPQKIIPGRLPVPLSENGIKQAEMLFKFFKDRNISQIFSSPVRRCKQTSEMISKNNTPIEFDIRLSEVLSAMQGSKEENWRELLYNSTDKIGGETQTDVYNRLADFWMTTKFEIDKNYLICSHGDPLYFLFQFLKKGQLSNDLSVNEPTGYQQKASVRIIDMSGENVQFVEYIENEDLLGYNSPN